MAIIDDKLMVIRWIAVRLAGVIALAIPWALHATDYKSDYRFRYDPKVFAFLPEWCKHTVHYSAVVPGGPDRAEIARLNRLMGPQNFKHLHHYCRGLFYAVLGTYFEQTKADRDAVLSISVGECDYVIDRVEETFPLLPEILTRKGESLVLLKRPEAIGPLYRAISLKPDYWPAYAALSDYFRDMGSVDEARQWLKKGLAAAPQAKALSRRLAELDKHAAKAASK